MPGAKSGRRVGPAHPPPAPSRGISISGSWLCLFPMVEELKATHKVVDLNATPGCLLHLPVELRSLANVLYCKRPKKEVVMGQEKIKAGFEGSQGARTLDRVDVTVDCRDEVFDL